MGFFLGREHRRAHEGEDREEQAEQRQDEDREVLVHGRRFYHVTLSPGTSGANRNVLAAAYDAGVTHKRP